MPPPSPDEGARNRGHATGSAPESWLPARSGFGTVRHPLILWSLLVFGLAATALGGWLLFRAREDAGGEAALPLTQTTGVVPAADFTLTSVDGRSLRLSDLRGQIVLLNFWATWCPPCRAELPDLEAIYRQDGVPHGLTVVGVDVEESAGLTQAFAKQYGVTFPLLPDPDGKVSDHLYAVRALPTSFLIDRAGNVRYTWVGEQTWAGIESRLARLW